MEGKHARRKVSPPPPIPRPLLSEEFMEPRESEVYRSRCPRSGPHLLPMEGNSRTRPVLQTS